MPISPIVTAIEAAAEIDAFVLQMRDPSSPLPAPDALYSIVARSFLVRDLERAKSACRAIQKHLERLEGLR